LSLNSIKDFSGRSFAFDSLLSNYSSSLRLTSHVEISSSFSALYQYHSLKISSAESMINNLVQKTLSKTFLLPFFIFKPTELQKGDKFSLKVVDTSSSDSISFLNHFNFSVFNNC